MEGFAQQQGGPPVPHGRPSHLAWFQYFRSLYADHTALSYSPVSFPAPNDSLIVVTAQLSANRRAPGEPGEIDKKARGRRASGGGQRAEKPDRW